MIVRKPPVQKYLFTITTAILIALLKVTSCVYAADNSYDTLPSSESALTHGAAAITSSVETNQDSDDKFLQLVTIGDPFNASDDQGLGAVNKVYQISQYEVTASQYVALLNSVAWKEDPHGLYHSEMGSDKKVACIQRIVNEDGTYRYELLDPRRGDLPITYVSLNDAERFCNWLENGTPGREQEYELLQQSTERGAYSFLQEGDQTVVEVNPSARYHIPSDDEWVKAAYYKGNGRNAGYAMYPTQKDTAPANGEGDITNFANYQTYRGGLRCNFLDTNLKITTVHCFDRTASFYQIHDMGGNVAEWTMPADGSGLALARGGSWQSGYSWYGSNDLMRTTIPKSYDPSTATNFIGFRVAVAMDSDFLSRQQRQEDASGTIDDFSMTDQKPDAHSSAWTMTPSEKVFLEDMLITGLVLSGSAGLFLIGEAALDAFLTQGLAKEVIVRLLGEKLTSGRLTMMGLHLFVNDYSLTEDHLMESHTSSQKTSSWQKMVHNGALLSMITMGFLTGEVTIDACRLGASLGVIGNLLSEKLTTGRVSMLVAHMLFNDCFVTEVQKLE